MGTKTIDEFVVAIGLDVKSLTAGQKTAFTRLDELEQKSDKTRKTVQSSGKAMGESFAGVTGELFKLTGAFIGMSAFKNATVEITKADAALGRLSKNLGVDPRHLKAWEGVANAYGSSADDIDAAFQRTNDVVTKWRVMGATPGDAFFKGAGLLGLDQSKFFADDTKDEERLVMLQKVFTEYAATNKEGRAGALVLAESMGYTRQTAQMLLDTNGILDDQLQKYQAIANLDDASTKNAIIRDQAWKSLQQTVEGVYRSMLDGMTEVFSKEAAHNREQQEGNRAAVTPGRAIKDVGLKVGAVVDALAHGHVIMTDAEMQKYNRARQSLWAGKTDANDIWRGEAAGTSMTGAIGAGSTSAQGQTKMSRADRNNNPGNIKYGKFAVQHGATGSDGTFAIFPDMATGSAAQQSLMKSYGARTLRDLIGRWAPPSENDTEGYIADVSAKTGIDPSSSAFNLSDPKTLYAVQMAQAQHEGLSQQGQASLASTQTSTTSIGNVNVYAGGASSSDIAARINNGSIHTYAANNGMPGVTQR